MPSKAHPKMALMLADLRRCGCTVVQGGRHPQVQFPSGHKVSISSTPSDDRGVLNSISQLRRRAAQDGLTLGRR